MKAIIAVPATLALCYRAYSHKSLTPAGIVVAALTAVAHAVHPWNLPFVLLVVFFLAGTRVTKIKKDVKATMTMAASGSSGGEGPRTHVQVLANSFVASVLCLLHAYQLHVRKTSSSPTLKCYAWGSDLAVIGIVANYAAVAADTFSSELGILSASSPRLITSLNFRKVVRGTNGGVTLWGLVAGLMGSLVVVTASMVFMPFCPENVAVKTGFQGGVAWGLRERQIYAWGMMVWGALGSVLDSLLGGWFQQSVLDTRSGRIVEGDGGKKVLVSNDGPNSMHFKKKAEIKAQLLNGDGRDAVPKPNVEDTLDEKTGGMDNGGAANHDGKDRRSSSGGERPSRIVVSGLGVLDNNEVNFLMALTMSLGAMGIASYLWKVPFSSLYAL